MFFTDREREVYEWNGVKFDPLRLLHTLTAATGGRLSELVAARNGPPGIPMPDGSVLPGGDVSPGSRARDTDSRARAEIELSDASRVAFRIPAFSESGIGDAVVLTALYEFLAWLEGKEPQAGTPP